MTHALANDSTELLTLVDRHDRIVGFSDKATCHENEGMLHRAFSTFLFDPSGRVLLQRRSEKKKLWGGYWSNSCCSHPRPDESVTAAAARRIHEELGVRASVSFLFKFEYRAAFPGLGVEHELCHVLAGLVRTELEAHPDEVSAVRLVEPHVLDRELLENPEDFTPWLLLEWPRIRMHHWLEVSQLLSPT